MKDSNIFTQGARKDMDKIFLSGALKEIIRPRSIITDGTFFKLHYRVSALVLCSFSILVSATQFIGDPIYCTVAGDIPQKLINTFCWVEGTFSLPKAFLKKVGKEIIYPGVDTSYGSKDEIIEHGYYQWVGFMLLLQAVMFYMPRLIWTSWEGNRIKSLLQELNQPVVPEDEKKRRLKRLVRYFRASMHNHSSYAFRYLLCELIALINVISQIYFINHFLGGEFTTYGSEVIEFSSGSQEGRIDPMVRVFPRITKCMFHHYGPTGDIRKIDTLCLLPLNIINEKIYIVLWFWFIILTVLTSLCIIYRGVLLGWPRLRYLALRGVARLTPGEQLKSVLKRTSYGDWFVIFLLAQNMDSINFRDFLFQLTSEMDSPLAEEKKDFGLDV